MSLRRRPRRESGGISGDQVPPSTAAPPAGGPSAPAMMPPAPGGTKVWLTLTSNKGISGTLTFALDPIRCPRAATNFKFLCDAHRDTEGYQRRQAFLGDQLPLPPPLKGTTVSAIRRNEMLEFGPSATASYWGGFFPDDKPVAANASSSSHVAATPTAPGASAQCTNVRVGALSMCNVGPDSNASRFFVTLREGQAELDADFVCFGQLVDGFDVLESLNSGDIKTDPKRGHAPRERLTISECGVVDPLAAFKAATTAAAADGDDDAANVVGARRGRGGDEVLSGALDVARVRVDANDEGNADDRIHSVMAMAGVLKKRRGEAFDPRFAGQLSAVEIDTSAPLDQGALIKPTQEEAMRAQQRMFEFDTKTLKTGQQQKQANKRAVGSAAGGSGKGHKLGQLAQQRREKLKASGRANSRANKTKFYK